MKPVYECLWLPADDDALFPDVNCHWWYVREDNVEDLLAATALMQIDDQCLVQDLTSTPGYSVQFNIIAWRMWMKTQDRKQYDNLLARKKNRRGRTNYRLRYWEYS